MLIKRICKENFSNVISTTLMSMSNANRLAYLDWMRGLAVVAMIETHVFNSFLRVDLRMSDAYMIAQSIGGLAAPLFLFIAGIMVGFRVDKRDEQGFGPLARMLDIWKRGGYILCIAELILFQQYVSQWAFGNWRYLLRVDILNCMALAIAVSGLAALGAAPKRPGLALFLGAIIAGLAPVACGLDWNWAPTLLRDYLIPGPHRFAFFPEAAYVPFGMAAGFVLRRAGARGLPTAMTWIAFAGFGLLYGGQFFSAQPYSLYPNADFWVNSPGLIVIRTGVMALILAISFLWTRFVFNARILRQLGTTSLLVYWVHVELVYGSWLAVWKRHLTVGQTALATILITVLMYALSVAKTRWAGHITAAISSLLPRQGKHPSKAPALNARA